MKIGVDEVTQVAALARLEISDDEKETYAAQLEDILNCIARLRELDTKDISPTFTTTKKEIFFRDDICEKRFANSPIDCAPSKEHEHYKVPKVI